MKRLTPVAILLLALPALALADPFSDFRIPDHYWRSGTLSASFLGDWAYASIAPAQVRQTYAASNLAPSLLVARDSDPLLLSLSLALAGATLDRDVKQDQFVVGSTQHMQSHQQEVDESWNLSGSVRAYPWATPVGLGLSARATSAFAQAWTRSDLRNEIVVPARSTAVDTRRQNIHAYDYNLTLEGSAGVGRVRDATVIYDVYVLEERLRAIGALTRPLSKGAREKLAALYYVAPFYGDPHDRPDRYFWRDVERVLREDGALGERGFDPYSVLRANEGYFYRTLRQRGWFVGPVVQARHVTDIERLDSRDDIWFYVNDTLTSHSASWDAVRNTVTLDQLNLGGSVEYHLPLGWRWQFDLTSEVTAPVRRGERGLAAASQGNATWLVADRWLASARLIHSRTYFRPRGGSSFTQNNWTTLYILQLGWYVEDHVQVSASYQESQTRDNSLGLPLSSYYSRDRRVSIGLAYRFLGALDAPGLIPPVRPLP